MEKKLNFPKSMYVEKVSLGAEMKTSNSKSLPPPPEQLGALGATLFLNGISLNDPAIIMKMKDYSKFEGEVLGCNGELIPKKHPIRRCSFSY